MRAPRLYLLDGLALAYRGFFAFIRRPLTTSRGEHISALFAFANSVTKLRDDESPDYWALAWDAEGPTVRHEEYPEYKGTRPPMPEELAEQLPHIKELAAAFGLPLIEKPGYEADDIMATLARRATEEGMEVVLVTNDKDLWQLVTDHVKVLAPRGRGDEDEWVDDDAVLAKWGVRPDQLGDVLALMGDSVDNIPGVKGIGQKTATKLVAEYGSLDGIYEHVEEIKQPSVRKKLSENKADAYFSRKLVSIYEDLDLPVRWEDLAVGPAHPEQLESLADRFELRRLRTWAKQARERGGAEPSSVSVSGPTTATATVAERRGESMATQATMLFEEDAPDPVAFGPEVRILDTPKALEEAAKELAAAPDGFCFDTETTHQDPMRASLVGFGYTIGERPAYVPIRHQEGRNVPIDQVQKILGPALADENIGKTGQHLKYDTLVLRREGFTVRGLEFDTLIASYLLEPDGAHGLDHLSRVHLGVEKIPTRALLGSGRDQKTMDQLSIPLVGAYCGEDVHCTWLLREKFLPELEAREQLQLFHDVEMRLVSVLVEMEREGVLIDKDFLAEMSTRLGEEAERLQQSIYKAAEKEFNINSGPQLAEILFNQLGLPAKRQTKTGYSTSADVLEELAPLHALPRLILQYRQLAKLKSTYVDALPALIDPDTGRLHTEFHQTVAATGRLSSSNPGLQNIPTRTPLGREVRRAFRSREGWHLVGADYSQIELRIMAHLSGDEALRESFAQGEDVHSSTARRIFELGDKEPSADQRAQAKVVNFGVMYGMGARALSLQLGMPIQKAAAFIRDYFKVHEGVKRYLDETLERGRKQGYVATILGRRRYLPMLSADSPRARAGAERAAINTPLQGSAADLIKVAMIRIQDRIERESLQTRLILQVHDELLFEVPPEELEPVEEMVKKEMIEAIALEVPLEVSLGVGETWFDVH